MQTSQSWNCIGWIQILFPDYWKFSKNWKMYDHCIKCQKWRLQTVFECVSLFLSRDIGLWNLFQWNFLVLALFFDALLNVQGIFFSFSKISNNLGTESSHKKGDRTSNDSSSTEKCLQCLKVDLDAA